MDNEYELLYLIKDGNEEALKYLKKKYNGLIYNKAKKYCNILSTDINDILNECELSFYIAVENYQDKYKFSTYLNNIIDNNLLKYIQSYNNKKNNVLNEAISYDKDDSYSISISSNIYNPEQTLFDEYNYNSMKNKIINTLTYKEELVFNLREQDYTIKEIAAITGSGLRTIYHVMDRIRDKTIKIMSS